MTDTEAAASESGAVIARRFFELLSVKDVNSWAELWHEEAVISVPYPPAGFASEIVGKSEIVAGFVTLFANFETFTASIDAVYPAADSDAVCVEYKNSATIVGGREYTNVNIAVFRFRDGLISEYHDYFDPRRFQVVVDALPSE